LAMVGELFSIPVANMKGTISASPAAAAR
jgi:hypothetical protein